MLVPSAKEDVTSGSTWSRGNYSSYVTVVDKGVVRSTNYSLTNTTRHAEQSGYIVASYTRDGVTYTAQERVTFEETYNVFVQYVRQNVSSYSSITRLKVRCNIQNNKLSLQETHIMVGQKYIPQTITGDLAKKVKITLLRNKADNEIKTSKSLFPQKTKIAWK